MARLQNTFEFVGALKFGKEVVKETVFDSGWAKKQANIIINESQSNGVFVNLEGGYNTARSNSVLTFGKNLFGQKGSKMEVAWHDRKETSILDLVADFKKVIIDLTVDKEAKEKYFALRNEIYNLETKTEDVTTEDEKKLKALYAKVRETVPHRYEFIHPLDAIEFFEKVSEKVKGKKFRVKGEIQVSYWKEKFYTNYVPTLFELVPDETPSKLSAQLDLYFTKDAADKSLLETDKTIYYNTYIYCYDSGHKADKFFPLQTVLNGKGYDFENPLDVARFKIINKHVTVTGRNVSHIPFEVKIVRGAEVVERSIETLTAAQQELIELGLRTVEDFKDKGTSFGENVSETRLVLPVVKNLGEGNDFSQGSIVTTLVEDDLIYFPPSPSTSTSKTKNTSVMTNNNVPNNIDIDDLPF